MKTSVFFLALIGIYFHLSAQDFVASSPITIAAGSGNYHPQIEVLGDGQIGVIWTDASGNDLYFAKQNGFDQFATPIQLNPSGLDVQDFNWSGADLTIEGNNVYVIFRSLGYDTGHIYLVKSTDNGLTFGDTVRVDNMLNDYGQFPDVAVYNDTVYATFMKHGFVTMNPQFVVSRSVDGGATFEPEVDVTNWLGDEACDCCQGEIIVNANSVIVFYRENELNTRDIKAVVSYDRGVTFTQYLPIDDHNWLIAACPSTGADARYMTDEVIVSAYRTTESSVAKIYLTEYNIVTDAMLNEVNVNMDGASNSGINYPQIYFDDNSLGIVWEGLGNSTDVFFNASSTGIVGILPVNAINVTNASNSQSKPDIAIVNGTFHLVYTELSGTKVNYCRVYSSTGITETENNLSRIYPNPTSNFLQIDLPYFQDEQVTITILSANGEVLQAKSYQMYQSSMSLDLNHFQAGIYLVQLTFDDRIEVHRIVKY